MWLLTLAGLSISISALIVALRTSDRSLLKRLSAHSMQLEQHSDTLEQCSLAIRNLRSRANMAALRAGKKELAESPDSSRVTGNGSASKQESADDQWARETNLAIAKGLIRPFGR